jgi:hypothetical protein
LGIIPLLLLQVVYFHKQLWHNNNDTSTTSITASSVTTDLDHPFENWTPNTPLSIHQAAVISPSISASNSSKSISASRGTVTTSHIPKKDVITKNQNKQQPPQPQPYKKRYPNLKGYKRTGGSLPRDVADLSVDPQNWRYVDNNTCLVSTNTNRTTATTDEINNTITNMSWQRRAPYAILLGVMKGGTHAVTASLWEHPQVARTGHWEMHFFNSPRVIRTEAGGIDQWQTRQNYARSFLKAIPNFPTSTTTQEDTTNASDNVTIAFESSPRYLLNSDCIPDMIMCVTPWVKLFAILRNPIERAESHYRFLDDSRRTSDKRMVNWDTWIQHDLRLLEESGVLQAINKSKEEEHLAWKAYQRGRSNSQMIVGRGLYVIQLEQYLLAMDRVGKPRSELLVLQSEAFRDHRQEEYNRLLHFLNLPPHRLRNLTDEHVTNNGGGGGLEKLSTPMPASIMKQLQELYQPYNERLYKLLGWESVWDFDPIL